jgi:hypothetical protein
MAGCRRGGGGCFTEGIGRHAKSFYKVFLRDNLCILKDSGTHFEGRTMNLFAWCTLGFAVCPPEKRLDLKSP